MLNKVTFILISLVTLKCSGTEVSTVTLRQEDWKPLVLVKACMSHTQIRYSLDVGPAGMIGECNAVNGRF